MSISALNAVWKLTAVSSTEKFVLVALADYADANGECFPSVRTLMKKTLFKESTLRASIRGLIERKLLLSRARAGESGRTTSNLFVVLPGREEMGEGVGLPAGGGGLPAGGGVGLPAGGALNDPSKNKPSQEGEGGAPSGARPRAAKGVKSLLPEGFEPDAKAVEMAKAMKLNPFALAAEFRDHYAANGKPMVDWQASFRSWVRKEIKLRAERGGRFL